MSQREEEKFKKLSFEKQLRYKQEVMRLNKERREQIKQNIKQLVLDERSKELDSQTDLLKIQLKDMDNTLKVAESYIKAKLSLHDDELDHLKLAANRIKESLNLYK